ncbi:MAG: TRAFs-binding domain-containing protein [Hyphomonadaceae bacterium]
MTEIFEHILRFARSGSLDRAWALFEHHGLGGLGDDKRALTLQARLVKDRAKRAKGQDRAPLFEQSAELYAKVGRTAGASYSLINAATLYLLAGKKSQSEALAREALSLIESNPEEGETPYWHEATRAEALLLLGQEPLARSALAQAIRTQPDAWEDHASTIGQLRLIQAELGQDPSWIDAFSPPKSVHFSGVAGLSHSQEGIAEAIRQFIAEEKPGFAYGALAAGADLIFAQAFLDHRDQCAPQAELHVVLPLEIDEFREISVRAFGEHWVPLFDRVLEEASTVLILGQEDAPLSLAIEHSDQVAMGCAVRNAHILQSQAVGFTVAAYGETLRPQLDAWQKSGRRLMVIRAARDRAVSRKPVTISTGHKLKTLVWVSNADREEVLSCLAVGVNLQSQNGEHWLACDEVVDAANIATQLAVSLEGAGVTILYSIFDPQGSSRPLLKRAQALAKASAPNTVTTDHNTALVLALREWDGSINELGELSTLWGNESIWSIAKL